MASAKNNQVDLFLIGKTGNGKSSTGNSILRREVFEISDSAISATFTVSSGWARFNGRVIKVVDGPGLCETRLDGGAAAEKLTKDMYTGMLQCPQGFHALVLVLKYGNRFTEEEEKTLANLRALFGENFVKEFCVVVFTYGECFDMNYARQKKSFSDWCKEQEDSLKDLLRECQFRAVLFRNCQEDKYDDQLTELLSLVDGLSLNGARYTNELFAQCAKERERFIVENKAEQLQENIQKKIDLLVSSYEEIKNVSKLNSESKYKLEVLKSDALALDAEIKSMDKGTGALDGLRKVVGHVLQSLEDEQSSFEDKMARCAEIEKLRQENELQKEHFNQASVEGLESLISENRDMMNIFMNKQDTQAENVSKLIDAVKVQNDSAKEDIEKLKQFLMEQKLNTREDLEQLKRSLEEQRLMARDDIAKLQDTLAQQMQSENAQRLQAMGQQNNHGGGGMANPANQLLETALTLAPVLVASRCTIS